MLVRFEGGFRFDQGVTSCCGRGENGRFGGGAPSSSSWRWAAATSSGKLAGGGSLGAFSFAVWGRGLLELSSKNAVGLDGVRAEYFAHATSPKVDGFSAEETSRSISVRYEQE